MRTRVWLFLTVIAALSAGSSFGVTWSDGFESGDFSGWDSTWSAQSPPAVVTSLPGLLPHSGSYMGRLGLDAYDQWGSGFSKDVGLTAVGDYVECYLGLSTDGADYPSQSVALSVHSTNAYMQVELHGDGTVHFQHDWQQDVYFVPNIPALQPGEWLYCRATIVPQGVSGAPGVVIYAEDPNGVSASVGNYYQGGGWEYCPNIMTVAGRNGAGYGNFPGGFDDFLAAGESEPVTCAEAIAMGYRIPEDYNENCYVDVPDLAHVADDWLRCMDPADANNCEQPWNPPPVYAGRVAYRASAAPAMNIDGVLNEWPANDYNPGDPDASQWVAIDRTYYGFPFAVSDAFMCLMYDAATDVVYGAVTVTDSDPIYVDIDVAGFNWNTQDNIELYIQGDPDNDTPLDPRYDYENGQQFEIGLDADEATTYTLWGDDVAGYPAVGANGETMRCGIHCRR